MSSSSLPSFSFRNVFIASTLLRVALILYSEWHDAHSLVKYTDVDYRVFTDAAAFLASPGSENQAEGPVKSVFGFSLEVGRYGHIWMWSLCCSNAVADLLAPIRATRIAIPPSSRFYSHPTAGFTLHSANTSSQHATSSTDGSSTGCS